MLDSFRNNVGVCMGAPKATPENQVSALLLARVEARGSRTVRVPTVGGLKSRTTPSLIRDHQIDL